METAVATPKKKTPLWAYPLFALLLAICVPIIIACLPIMLVVWIWYLITSPFEKKKFHKSGYAELYPKYSWGITRTIHYNIYKKLKEQNIPFEYEKHTEKDFGDIIVYILKNDIEYNLVLGGGDLGGLHFNEEQKDWVYDNDHEYNHNEVDEYKEINPFEFLKTLGENKYPKATKNYFVCMSQKQIKHLEISKQQKDKLRQDKRFIELSELLKMAVQQ